MPEYQTPGLKDLLGHLDFQKTQEQQVLSAKWDADARELKAKLNVELARKQITRDQAAQEINRFMQESRVKALEFKTKFDIERDKIQTFYQPAAPEGENHIKQYKEVQSHLDNLERQMRERFTERGPREPGTFSQRRKINLPGGKKRIAPFNDPGGVGPRVYVREVTGFDDKGKTITEPRLARDEELRDWALLKDAIEEARRLRNDVLSNRHVQARTSGSALDTRSTSPLASTTIEEKPQQTSTAQMQSVTMVSPNGVTGTVPKNRVQEALRKGYTIQE